MIIYCVIDKYIVYVILYNIVCNVVIILFIYWLVEKLIIYLGDIGELDKMF